VSGVAVPKPSVGRDARSFVVTAVREISFLTMLKALGMTKRATISDRGLPARSQLVDINDTMTGCRLGNWYHWEPKMMEEVSMAAVSSFDIVSKFDEQELKNAVDQARREINQRYDLKDTKTEIQLNPDDIVITTDSEYTLQAVRDVLESKVVRRGLSLKILDYGKEEPASGGRVRQEIKLRQGIPDELAKQITKQIRTEHKKVTPQIQGDAVRVQAKSKDELQAVIQSLKAEDFPVALQFVNYR
jgi:uncharacterized protein YajQ (UPF0234 family)